ncbi:MAG: hypothetical protein ACHRHE_12565 [Tepidisphaerales bacterium]
MSPDCRRHRGWVIAIISVGVAVPLVLYGLVFGRGLTVPKSQAQQMLADGSAVLVELGVTPPPSVGPVRGASRWALESILAASSPDNVPQELRGRKLLLVCPGSMESARAAVHLRDIGVRDAFAIRGGLQDWLAAVPGCPQSVLLHANPVTDAAIPLFRNSPVYEQWLAVVTFFGVKALYSLISAAIVIALWRRTEPDLAALRRAMVCFFVGEAFCFINVMIFFEDSFLMEHLHSVGMVLALAFTVYALLEGVDARLMHFSDEARCAAKPLCGRCIKQEDVHCGLHRAFMVVLPGMAILAALPLFADIREEVYNTRILGILHSYRHPAIHQVYELRYLPIVAILLLANCLVVLWRVELRPVPISKILFSAAAGAMGFSLFRLIVVAPFAEDQVWFAAWEETTELLYVALVGGVLLVFARGLLGTASHSTA